MSMVTVHGPNTMYVTGAGGAGTAQTVASTPPGGGTVTADISNGRRFTFAGAGDRLAADYDWSFTGETAQPNVKNGSITFSSGGAKTITLTLGTSGGTTPAGGTYTFAVVATTTAVPRSMPPDGEEEEGEPQALAFADEVEEYDPADHTVAEVEEYAEAHPDEVQDLLDAEVAGKNRSTLITFLEQLVPFDPGDYTVQEVVDYATENPDQLYDIIAAEQANKNRTTLLRELEGLQE
jgi:hypothetical protein